MSFIRKKRKGNTYYYELVENERVGERVVQKVLEYFPTLKEACEYAKKYGIEAPSDDGEWIDKSLLTGAISAGVAKPGQRRRT